jgi:hypothetical protein
LCGYSTISIRRFRALFDFETGRYSPNAMPEREKVQVELGLVRDRHERQASRQ